MYIRWTKQGVRGKCWAPSQSLLKPLLWDEFTLWLWVLRSVRPVVRTLNSEVALFFLRFLVVSFLIRRKPIWKFLLKRRESGRGGGGRDYRGETSVKCWENIFNILDEIKEKSTSANWNGENHQKNFKIFSHEYEKEKQPQLWNSGNWISFTLILHKNLWWPIW